MLSRPSFTKLGLRSFLSERSTATHAPGRALQTFSACGGGWWPETLGNLRLDQSIVSVFSAI